MWSLRDVATNTAGLPFNFQSGQPVTNISVSLPNTFIGVANCDRISHDNPGAMLCGEKAPPIDSFTGKDITITFDEWLLTLE